jgi:hypothetical protein
LKSVDIRTAGDVCRASFEHLHACDTRIRGSLARRGGSSGGGGGGGGGGVAAVVAVDDNVIVVVGVPTAGW